MEENNIHSIQKDRELITFLGVTISPNFWVKFPAGQNPN
jgi:hypothetical protein